MLHALLRYLGKTTGAPGNLRVRYDGNQVTVESAVLNMTKMTKASMLCLPLSCEDQTAFSTDMPISN